MKIGQRIDVFEVQSGTYGDLWTPNGWYAEKIDSPYCGNKYGRDMVCNLEKPPFTPHQNIINEHVKQGMVKVGTMIIKSIKIKST